MALTVPKYLTILSGLMLTMTLFLNVILFNS